MHLPNQAPPVERTPQQSWCQPRCPIPLGESKWRVYWNGQPSEILTVRRDGANVSIDGPFWYGTGLVYSLVSHHYYQGEAHLKTFPGAVARHVAELWINPAKASVVVAWPDGKDAKRLEWRLIEGT